MSTVVGSSVGEKLSTVAVSKLAGFSVGKKSDGDKPAGLNVGAMVGCI